jgi:hypothetical protein
MSVGLVVLYVAGVVAISYWIPIRLWFLRWGVTDAELTGFMPGDDVLVKPNYSAMLALTIEAPPEYVWPWLVQMGNGRGGLYSYDWLDRLFGYLDGPSADRILPEFQRLSPGDVIPIGGAPGGFPVKAVHPYHALVLGGETAEFQWTWQLGLLPVSRFDTRLISRSRARVPGRLGSRLLLVVLEPAAFIMTRRMLIGIKRRAETLYRHAAVSGPQAVR